MRLLSNIASAVLFVLGAVASVLLSSWLVFSALMLFTGTKVAYLVALRKQRQQKK